LQLLWLARNGFKVEPEKPHGVQSVARPRPPRRHQGDRDRGDRTGPNGISVGARFRGLDRAGGASGFNWGQAEARAISKQGDRYLRRILVVGAIAVFRRAQENPGKYLWLAQLLARRPFKVVAVALANKMARTAWALVAHGGTHRAPELAEAADSDDAGQAFQYAGHPFRDEAGHSSV
jgi:hypothetical protein